MTDVTNSPLPWKAVIDDYGEHDRAILADDGSYVAAVENVRDADLIVERVNRYPELVAALRGLLADWEALTERYGVLNLSPVNHASKARAALASTDGAP